MAGWALRRTGPQRPPPQLAVVLGGGGPLGAYQVGVIEALARAGVRPDLLIGTSVGALNAAFWACNPGADVGSRLLHLWQASALNEIFRTRRWWLRLVRHTDHLFEAAGLLRVIQQAVVSDQRIERATIPLAVVATDFGTGERVVLREGNLLRAVLASTAIPGVFPRVDIAGRSLVDGGVVANADLEAAVEAGATHALVVDVMGQPPAADPTDLIGTLERTVNLALRRQTDLVLAAEQGRIEVSLLRPRLPSLPRLWDFTHTAELFDMGRTAAEALLRRQPLVPSRTIDHRRVIPESPSQGAQARPRMPSQSGLPWGRRGALT